MILPPRSAAVPVVLGVVAAIVAFVFGADGWRVAGWGIAVAAIALLRTVPAGGEAPDAGHEPGTNRGRSEVDQMAWSMLEQGVRVRTAVLRRVAAVAAAPLREAGLDPARPGDAAAIDALLGSGAALLLQADDRRAVALPALETVLTGLERLTRTEARLD